MKKKTNDKVPYPSPFTEDQILQLNTCLRHELFDEFFEVFASFIKPDMDFMLFLRLVDFVGLKVELIKKEDDE